MNNIVCISRAERYSPNSVERDQTIFDCVIKELRSKGLNVDTICEDDFRGVNDQTILILSMARSERVIHLLRKAEKAKINVINPTVGLRNSRRDNLFLLLRKAKLPYPSSLLLQKGEGIAPCSLSFPLWAKRSDGCAQKENDVCHIEKAEELTKILENFWERGIQSVVLNEHLTGDLIKFYGVEGTDFFYHTYATGPCVYSKFGLESINGEAHHYKFSITTLHEKITKIAQLLKLPIYGGDAIISKDGTFKIIDFNDFPSFSPCCKEAASAIARLTQKYIFY
ncbi:MAG: hypothetical protein RR386_01500 [Bacteroidaceae bacterium]